MEAEERGEDHKYEIGLEECRQEEMEIVHLIPFIHKALSFIGR